MTTAFVHCVHVHQAPPGRPGGPPLDHSRVALRQEVESEAEKEHGDVVGTVAGLSRTVAAKGSALRRLGVPWRCMSSGVHSAAPARGTG